MSDLAPAKLSSLTPAAEWFSYVNIQFCMGSIRRRPEAHLILDS